MLAEALPPADVEDALPPVALLLEELLLELFELEVELEEELFVFELLLLLVVVREFTLNRCPPNSRTDDDS